MRLASLATVSGGVLLVATAGIGTAQSRTPEEPPCQGADLQLANTAAASAKSMIDKAIIAIDKPSSADAARLTTWFGINSSNGAAKVRQTLVNSRVFTSGVSFRCAVNTDISIGDVYAYVRANRSFAVVLGGFFLKASDTGFNSQPGVLVHETTHFTLAGATDDNAYGVEGARKLARTNPRAAQENADNYEYFVEAIAFNLN